MKYNHKRLQRKLSNSKKPRTYNTNMDKFDDIFKEFYCTVEIKEQLIELAKLKQEFNTHLFKLRRNYETKSGT